MDTSKATLNKRELDEAVEQFNRAMGSEGADRHYKELWDRARHEGKPRYIDGVVMSSISVKKSIVEMRKMEQNAAMLFAGLRSGKFDRDELLRDFNLAHGINFRDERELLETFSKIREARTATERLADNLDRLDHRVAVMRPEFEPEAVSMEQVKAGTVPEGMEVLKQETMRSHQFLPPCEMRGGRCVVHCTRGDLVGELDGDRRPVEVVLSSRQLVGIIDLAVKRECAENPGRQPVVATGMTAEFSAGLARAHPGSSELERQEKHRLVRAAINKEILAMSKERAGRPSGLSPGRVPAGRDAGGGGMER